MVVSEKLKAEILLIVSTHSISLLLLLAFTAYICFKARKTPLMVTYIGLVTMLSLWLGAKVFKTVAPSLGLRWLFIVIQYFGVQFLGFFLVLFAWCYTQGRLPSRRATGMLVIPPLLGYLTVLTNPWHMGFYSYFDIYRDRFGPWFIPVQSLQYLYLTAGILMLSRGFTRQPAFVKRHHLARLFSGMILFPIGINIYYILFKLDLLPWILPFPVFDITPVAGTVALILFMIPAVRYRFLDISPLSFRHLFQTIPQGIAFTDPQGRISVCNQSISTLLGFNPAGMDLQQLWAALLPLEDLSEEDAPLVNVTEEQTPVLLPLPGGITCRVTRKALDNSSSWLFFSDITPVVTLRETLKAQNNELAQAHEKLSLLAIKIRDLAIVRTKKQVAQNVHDILGHSLTVVTASMNLVVSESSPERIRSRFNTICELLLNSLTDLTGSLQGDGDPLDQTTLTRAIGKLQEAGISIDFTAQGTPRELDARQTESIFRLCQEAVTNSIRHGQADNLHIILRYGDRQTEVYVIDDGRGCPDIQAGNGLEGMISRIRDLDGTITFGSDGTKGFHIHAVIPD